MVRTSNTYSPERAGAPAAGPARFGAVTARGTGRRHGGWTPASARGRLLRRRARRAAPRRRVRCGRIRRSTPPPAPACACQSVRGLEPCRVSVATAPHAIACARVAAALELAYPDHRVTGRARAAARRARSGRAAGERTPGRTRGRRRAAASPGPRALAGGLRREELPVAVEVELTVKAPARLLRSAGPGRAAGALPECSISAAARGTAPALASDRAGTRR